MGLEQIPWKQTALRLFPECAERLADADTPFLLRFELWELFQAAYREPRNKSPIERIYQFADWCEPASSGETAVDDLPTCVSVCFFEEIPSCEAAREDMPDGFAKDEFIGMRDVFRCTFAREDYEKIEKSLLPRKIRAHSRTPPK